MIHQNLKRFVTLTFILFIVSCHDDVYELPVTIDYKLLNQDFREARTFKVGDNILFQLSITNHTLDEVKFYQKEMDIRTYCRVWSIDQIGNVTDYGRPYLDIFCGHEPISIAPKETFVTTISWYPPIPWSRDSPYFNPYVCSINEDIPVLGPGEYRNHFSSVFRFTFDHHRWVTSESFPIEFTIE